MDVSAGTTRSARIDVLLYVGAAVSYTVLGVYNRWLLDWVIGPLWLVAWLQVVPALGRLVRRRSNIRSDSRSTDGAEPAA